MTLLVEMPTLTSSAPCFATLSGLVSITAIPITSDDVDTKLLHNEEEDAEKTSE
ncbi:hypothetical protein KIN20_018034 [Parelaphostrongylus tenuis]|uniref:Uncharacterized protein n=1 Tax=Parelaphostrongylus tenuis TaxID=148309 RepID=A0AAD5QP50_PARTN|nr:hypothetical protein KIN20_018034 [Parelaphostrongylus tenuis]